MTTTVTVGTAVTQDFGVFTDSVDVATSSFGTQKCGVPVYSITKNDGVTSVPGYLTLSGTVLSLETTDDTHIGTHDIQLHITLTDYAVTLAIDF